MTVRERDEVIFTVKNAVYVNAHRDYKRDCVEMDGNEVDHLAEEVAVELGVLGYKRTIDKETQLKFGKALWELARENGYPPLNYQTIDWFLEQARKKLEEQDDD